jgi:hypothetical protein
LITTSRIAIITLAIAVILAVSLVSSQAAVGLSETPASIRIPNSSILPAAPGFQGGWRVSNPSEIASGSEIRYQERKEVVLNIRPCRGNDGEFVTFYWPFKRIVLGDVRCGDGQVQVVQIEKQ